MPVKAIPTVKLPSGEVVPAFGQGTWKMGEDPLQRKTEAAVLQAGLDMGMSLIDTAEMYGEGGAEEVVGDALQGRREEVFLVSKFYPQHARQPEVIGACDRSLKRMRIDCIDLYLLHWRGNVPFQETLAGLVQLKEAGKIRHWGVSNFDVADMEEWVALPGGSDITTNQVLYNLKHRGIEADLQPWCRKRQIPLMAYSPIEQGAMLTHPTLIEIAARHQGTPAQIAMAWLLQQKDIMVIPKTSSLKHLNENLKALDINLAPQDLQDIDRAFPPPKAPVPLEMI